MKTSYIIKYENEEEDEDDNYEVDFDYENGYDDCLLFITTSCMD